MVSTIENQLLASWNCNGCINIVVVNQLQSSLATFYTSKSVSNQCRECTLAIFNQPAWVTGLLLSLECNSTDSEVASGSVSEYWISLQTLVTIVVSLSEELTIKEVCILTIGSQLLLIVGHVTVDLLIRNICKDVRIELIQIFLALQGVGVHELLALAHIVERAVGYSHLTSLLLIASNLPGALTRHSDEVGSTSLLRPEGRVGDVEVDSHRRTEVQHNTGLGSILEDTIVDIELLINISLAVIREQVLGQTGSLNIVECDSILYHILPTLHRLDLWCTIHLYQRLSQCGSIDVHILNSDTVTNGEVSSLTQSQRVVSTIENQLLACGNNNSTVTKVVAIHGYYHNVFCCISKSFVDNIIKCSSIYSNTDIRQCLLLETYRCENVGQFNNSIARDE